MDSTIHPNPLWNTPKRSNFDRNSGMHPKMTVQHRYRTFLPLPMSKSTAPNRRTSNTATESTIPCDASFGIRQHFRVVPMVPILDSYRFGISWPNFGNSHAMHHHNWIENCIVHWCLVDRYIFALKDLRCRPLSLRLIFSYNNRHCSNISIRLRHW